MKWLFFWCYFVVLSYDIFIWKIFWLLFEISNGIFDSKIIFGENEVVIIFYGYDFLCFVFFFFSSSESKNDYGIGK